MEGLVRAVARAEAKTVHLEVAADNIPALVLYHRLGFKEAGRRKDYYERADGSVDALRLALAL
jgi:ribosomal-protein-alanine N-acetyltransferase